MSVRALPAILFSLLLLPTALAGDEANPEIRDPAGDVDYSPFYVGPQDHDYVDLTSVFWQYDNQTDLLRVTATTVDGQRLTTGASDWRVYCQLESWVRGDEGDSIRLVLEWEKAAGSNAMEITSFLEEGEERTPVSVGFQMKNETPGYASFLIERSLVAELGFAIETIRADCGEQFYPAFGTIITVLDMAEQVSTFPIPATDGRSSAPEECDAPCPRLDEAESGSASPMPGKRTNGLNVFAILGVFMVSAMSLRGRSSRLR